MGRVLSALGRGSEAMGRVLFALDRGWQATGLGLHALRLGMRAKFLPVCLVRGLLRCESRCEAMTEH